MAVYMLLWNVWIGRRKHLANSFCLDGQSIDWIGGV